MASNHAIVSSSNYSTPSSSPPNRLFLPNSSYSTVQLAIYTWNCNNVIPNQQELRDLIDDIIHVGVDIIIFGLQENYIKPIAHPWSIIDDPLANLVSDMLVGEDYIRFHYNYLIGITQFIFCRSSLLPYISIIDSQVLKTGFSGWMGNKGAIITTLRLGSVTLDAITCHLCSYEENLARRNEELQLIFAKHPLKAKNYSFIHGDLNYRLRDVKFEDVLERILANNHLPLLDNDTLREEIRNNNIPSILEEAQIQFKPTYKFIPGTDDYRNNKNRTPAWCDRILYHHSATPTIPTKLICRRYSIWDTPLCSDHRVVYGYYDITTDWMIYSPPVEFILPDVTCATNIDLTVKIVILSCKGLNLSKPTIKFSSWDWVGLHRFGCLHTKDYTTYVWSPLKSTEIHTTEISRSVTFSCCNLPKHSEDDLYQLYYHSHHKGEILAVSNPFSFTDTNNVSCSLMNFN